MNKKKDGSSRLYNEIKYVFCCVNKINPDYVNVQGFKRNKEIIQQAAENAFTAELYYHLRLEQSKWFPNEGLIWHFDLNKERVNSIRPDLVFHHSPHDRKDQRIFLEVKTNKSVDDNSIRKDLEKLDNAVSDNDDSMKLGFKYGIYIVGNSDVLQLIKKYKFKLDVAKKLYLITFESSKFNPEVTPFIDLI